MRTTSLLLLLSLTLALCAGPSDAAKPNDAQVKKLSAETDLSCRGSVDGLPGAQNNYDAPSICKCAHAATAAGLSKLDLDNPAAPTKADREKIANSNNHAIWACAQPSYAKALSHATEMECRENVGSIASAQGLSDTQKQNLCTCIGTTFAQSADLAKVAETSPGKMQTFANDALQKAYSACKVKATAQP